MEAQAETDGAQTCQITEAERRRDRRIAPDPRRCGARAGGKASPAPSVTSHPAVRGSSSRRIGSPMASTSSPGRQQAVPGFQCGGPGVHVGRLRGDVECRTQLRRALLRQVQPGQHTEESRARQVADRQGPSSQVERTIVLGGHVPQTVFPSRLTGRRGIEKLPTRETRTTRNAADRSTSRGRLPASDCARGPANAGAKESLVHPIPKALLKAGTLGSAAIA